MKHFFDILRYALSFFIVIKVWQNSHWSVALSLTLINISIEIIARLLKRIIQGRIWDDK